MTTDLQQPPGSGPGEWIPFMNAIRAGLEPFAQSQAQVQQRAIEADLEKHRINAAAHGEASKRAFTVTLFVLAIVAGAIGAFIAVGQYTVAYNALSFAAGGALGFGIARSRR